MRTRTLITGAAFLAVGVVGPGSASAQALRGSDTLEDITENVLAACPAAPGVSYIGGGSSAGQGAMSGAGPTQHVAPMSRQLNGTACTANSRQLLIGLDGLAIVAKNATHQPSSVCTDDIGTGPLVLTGVPSQFVPCTTNTACTTLFGATATCDTVRQFCQVSGSLGGCTAAQGCSPDGTYTFDNGNGTGADDWLDVLRQIYGGMNHTSAGTLIHSAGELNADGTAICFTSAGATRNCVRNPARIDCANPIRGVLLSSWSQIIRSPLCTSATPECVKLRHAYRRDDLSGTTDAFQAIVGLVSIPNFTTLTNAGPNREIADLASTANPFCNAGTAAMNKGFSDGLDLDPYRRACIAGPAPDRLGLESVCQAAGTANNGDVSCYPAGGTPATYPQRERSSPQRRGVGNGGSVDTLAAFQTEYLANATRPRCLGVVQTISIPQDLTGATVWANTRYPQGGNCTPGVRSFVNPLPANTILCPDGSIKAAGGTCRLPQNTANGRFDCIVDSPLPAGAGISDARVFNLGPVNNLGNMAALLDSYTNPNFPTTNLRRFARRYYGVHMVRPDNSGSPPTIAGSCQFETDTSQIGCLVKASPCSIGFAGREAVDAVAPLNNVSLRIQGVEPTITTIQNLATGGTPVYPLARKLWFNSFNNPGDLVGFLSPNLTAGEVGLSACMGLPGLCTVDADCTGVPGTGNPPCVAATGRCTSGDHAIVDSAVSTFNFVTVPASVPRLILNSSGQGCPLPL
jgi:ABC-type phosphate transport system substrate-binding protein